MRLRQIGVPQEYSICPVCKGEFRRCDCSYEQADAVWIRGQKNKAKAGKTNGEIARTLEIDGVRLFLWKDSKVTWEAI